MKIPIVPLTCMILSIFSCTEATKTGADWYKFKPSESTESSVIGMTDWLDKPAGNHGFLQIDGHRLAFEDGTPIKFWGVNICSQRPYVEATTADQWSSFLAHYGINGVRFHKFTSHAIKGTVSTELDPGMFDRFDYFNQSLKEKGIYYGWSHIYGHKPKSGDSSRLIAYKEIVNATYPWAHLNGATSGVINFAEDLQDLNIDLTVNMLNHLNPYTGLRYADDPALAFIELQNEDNIYWGAIHESLRQMPTYQALLNSKFSNWLLKKYGDETALLEAWGRDALPEGQSLRQKNIDPQPDHHLFSSAYEKAMQSGEPISTHVRDKMRFLYETQQAFYDRFTEAIRKTGYKGTIVGSCWQAGSGISHYYNLYNDYLVGIIDRHNYFGGGTGHRLDTGRVRNAAMVSKPGSGLLSTGMQQVADRPFAFSEWMSLMPNEWIAEGPPIIAAYGMGLQGWDASFQFASDYPHFTETIHTPGVYNTMSPTQLGLYPVLAMMVYRNDIAEAPVISSRNVSLKGLAEGRLGFEEQVKQDYDVKYFTGDVPSSALAAGKLVVNFTEDIQPTKPVDMANYSPQLAVIESVTGALKWDFSGKGFFTINTPGTKGIIGFTGGETHILSNVTMRVKNPFGILLLTALDKGSSIEDATHILVVSVARAKNSGMEYNENKTKLVKVGTAPILLEPVSFTIQFTKNQPDQLHVLDHMGRATNQSFRISNGLIDVNGVETETLYYLIERNQ